MKTIPSAHEPSFGGTLLCEPSYKSSNCTKKARLEKQTACKNNLTLDLFWQLNSELHNLKNLPKDGSNPLSDPKFCSILIMQTPQRHHSVELAKCTSCEMSNTLPKEQLQDLTEFWSEAEALVSAIMQKED